MVDTVVGMKKEIDVRLGYVKQQIGTIYKYISIKS